MSAVAEVLEAIEPSNCSRSVEASERQVQYAFREIHAEIFTSHFLCIENRQHVFAKFFVFLCFKIEKQCYNHNLKP